MEGSGLIVLEASDRLLPVLPIKLKHLWVPRLDVEVVQCAYVHRIQLRCATRTGEDVDSADDTEVVLGFAGSKPIGSELILPAEQPEVALFDRVMQSSLLAADGTVAFDDTLDQSVDLEPHTSAMTRPGVTMHVAWPNV
jgi:hypothetical protein